ncbi:hypothetical protein CCHR01_16840 [Colletotrichum chrysophilum]|uniref:Uncharacterized protein n=1 Tax=Colletotrichum chrysophilum TaxID=1836956 RepID=A0AAD9A3P6_9PEZI|nr:hypothetical protein CCHR01_16840 [Colletotrichum chrysophilum]
MKQLLRIQSGAILLNESPPTESSLRSQLRQRNYHDDAWMKAMDWPLEEIITRRETISAPRRVQGQPRHSSTGSLREPPSGKPRSSTSLTSSFSLLPLSQQVPRADLLNDERVHCLLWLNKNVPRQKRPPPPDDESDSIFAVAASSRLLREHASPPTGPNTLLMQSINPGLLFTHPQPTSLLSRERCFHARPQDSLGLCFAGPSFDLSNMQRHSPLLFLTLPLLSSLASAGTFLSAIHAWSTAIFRSNIPPFCLEMPAKLQPESTMVMQRPSTPFG